MTITITSMLENTGLVEEHGPHKIRVTASLNDQRQYSDREPRRESKIDEKPAQKQ
jgi:hypothetical protein